MSQTLRRQLRNEFENILSRYPDKFTLPEYESLAEILADATLEVSGISKKVTLPEKAGVDWLIAGGVPSDKIAELNAKENRTRSLCDAYERAMGFNPLPWGKLEKLQKFLYTKTIDEIKQFAAWSKSKYSGFSPAKARMYPNMVIDLWPQSQDKKEDKGFML